MLVPLIGLYRYWYPIPTSALKRRTAVLHDHRIPLSYYRFVVSRWCSISDQHSHVPRSRNCTTLSSPTQDSPSLLLSSRRCVVTDVRVPLSRRTSLSLLIHFINSKLTAYFLLFIMPRDIEIFIFH